MECIVCMEEFNAVERRPKCLPCGHTVCSQCLGDLQEPRCPYCREDLTAPATAMPDNYVVLDLVGQRQQTGPSVDSDSHARSLKAWCRDCNEGAAESCLDNGHTLCSLRKLRSERAAATLQQLGDAATAAAKVVRTLEDAKDAVEGLLQEWRARLRQVQQADRELRAEVDEGGDLEAGQPEGLQQLQDAASLLEGMECALRHHGGAEWRGDLGGGRSLLHALVLHLHRHGRITKEPPQQESAVATSPPARDCIEELNLNTLSCLPEERAAALARVRQSGVRRMTMLRCHCAPAWALAMLLSAAPTLEELSLIDPHERLLLVVHAMPKLRRLMWWCNDGDSALDAQPLLLPALPRSSLKWLRVTGLPRPTLISLLRAHSACLEVLWLCVGTPGSGQWPAECDDLDALLGQCGLRRVSKVVLIRHTVFHNSACRAQVSAVRRVLPAAAVQCMKCDKVVWENL